MCFSVAMSAACCAGQAFCNNCCQCCKSCCGTSMKEQIRIAYIFFQLILYLFVVFVLYWLQDILEPFDDYIKCPAESGGKLTCLGVGAVYRMSFALATLFIIIMVCMCCRNEFSKVLNEGLWCFKITYILFIFIGSLFIERSFFEGYRDVSKIISMFYLIFQAVCMIEIFYIWGFKWFNVYARGSKSMGVCLITTAVIMLIGIIIFNVYNIIWFEGCTLNLTISIINIVVIVITIIIQIIKTGSLIATLANCLYITYLTFSAQLSGPKENCTELYFDESALYIELIVSFVFMIMILFYLTFAKKDDSSTVVLMPGNVLTSTKDKQVEEQEEQIELQEKKTVPNQENGQPQQIKIQVEQVDPSMKSYQNSAFIFFHFVMALTAVYSAMLITNWGSPNIDEQSKEVYKPSETSYWAKIITSWVSGLIYIYSIFRKQIIDEQSKQSNQQYVINATQQQP